MKKKREEKAKNLGNEEGEEGDNDNEEEEEEEEEMEIAEEEEEEDAGSKKKKKDINEVASINDRVFICLGRKMDYGEMHAWVMTINKTYDVVTFWEVCEHQ